MITFQIIALFFITGRFGTWQWLLFALLSFVCLLDGLFENLYAFTAFTPKYRCGIPFCEHPQNASYFGTGEKTEEKGNFPIYVKVARKFWVEHLLAIVDKAAIKKV